KHPGYALISKIFHGAAPGVKLTLQPTTRTRVDPTQPLRVSEQGITLSLDPNQLVDAAGNQPTGPLNLDIYRYNVDQGEVPGDTTGLALDQAETTFIPRGVVAIEITNDQGTPYDIAPSSTARLSFPIPAAASASSLPFSLVLARYDETKGVWVV